MIFCASLEKCYCKFYNVSIILFWYFIYLSVTKLTGYEIAVKYKSNLCTYVYKSITVVNEQDAQIFMRITGEIILLFFSVSLLVYALFE